VIDILTPNQLSNIPNNIVELYSQLEEFIITDFSRRVAKTGEITSTAEWQKQRAKLIGIKNIEAKIAETLNLTNAQIESLFPEIALTSIKAEQEIYKKAKLDPLTLENSQQMKDYLSAAIKNTKGDIVNITQSMGFAQKLGNRVTYKPIAKFYQDELNLAQLKVQSGVIDYNIVIKQAVKKMTDSGLRFVDYESGWSNRIDVATRRAVLTGTHQMTQQMSNANMDKLISKDEQYAEVTSHSPCRPSHLKFQGRVFKIVGSSSEYPNLADSTGLGTVGGLKGSNCHHDYLPFIPNVSIRTYSDKQLEEMERESKKTFGYKGKEYTHYEASQYQREIETAIRQTKRELIGYKEAGLDSDFKISSIKLSQQRREYKEFSEVSGVRQKNDRSQLVGFDRSISQQATNAAKK